MRHLASLHSEGKRRGRVAELRLAEAYRNIFSGEDGEIVLADLAAFCGEYRPVQMRAGIDMAQILVDMNARRAVLGRILHFAALSGQQLNDLRRAALAEQIADRNEGEI